MARQESCLLIIVKSLILISLLISALIAGFFYVKNKLNEYFNRGNTIVVPDFRGKHLVQVFKEKPPDLILEKAEEKYDSRYPKDYVISQNPAPGTKVKPNKKVLLIISSGSKPTTVPDLTNKTLREARIMLFNNQLQEGEIAYIFNSKFSKDKIITQNPLPSMNQVIQGKVNLLVSKGQPRLKKIILPSFIGRNLNEVSEQIQKMGLKVGRVLSYKDPNKATLTIISTNPVPFETVNEGSIINFLVSSGNQEGNAKPSDLHVFMFTKDQIITNGSMNLSSSQSSVIEQKSTAQQYSTLNNLPSISQANEQGISTFSKIANAANNNKISINNLNNISSNVSPMYNATTTLNVLATNNSNVGNKTNIKNTLSANNQTQIRKSEPKIIIDENSENNITEENTENVLTPDTEAVDEDSLDSQNGNNQNKHTKHISNASSVKAKPEFTEVSFVMPDGFMPKEVKFVHITPTERKQVYVGVHKPLEFVKISVPKIKGSKVQIYINDIPIEERNIE